MRRMRREFGSKGIEEGSRQPGNGREAHTCLVVHSAKIYKLPGPPNNRTFKTSLLYLFAFANTALVHQSRKKTNKHLGLPA